MHHFGGPKADASGQGTVMIRVAVPADAAQIRELHVAAFPTPAEADLVEQLKADGDTEISLVAWDEDRIVGHVLLSKMRTPFRALGLAPVAVAEQHRRKGIAASLINAAIEMARDDGWQAIFILGEPAYYQHFGFSVEKAASYASPYAGPYFMMLQLTSTALTPASGRVDYARAFDALG